MGIEEDIKQGKAYDNPIEKLIVNIMFTNSWLMDQQGQIFKPFGLTAPQYNVLRILRGQYPEPCTVNTLIERMIDRMSNASRIVDRLEVKQLVERTVCEKDKRAKDVLITESGLLLLEKVDMALQQWLKSLEKISGDKANQLSESLDLLRA